MMDPTTLDDHAFAVWAAERAGSVLLDVRAGAEADGLEGKALKDAGDAAAQAELDRVLTQHRPDDSVLSEEASDDKSRLTARRVWIIDPLDGTREFSEPPRDDWAVHVALWEDGELVAGAVAQPGIGATFDTGHPPLVHYSAGSGRWTVVDTGGVALGVQDLVKYDPAMGELRRGDALLLYTDGVVESPRRELSDGIDWLQGQAERLVASGFRHGARKLVDAVGSADDDRALLLIWRT